MFNLNAATILVVEDNPGVLDLVEMALTGEGHRVIGTKTAEEALEKFKALKTVDLVFTDLVLPHGESGVDLVKKISKLDNRCVFLLGSGYAEKGRKLAQGLKGKRSISYIGKPYDIDEMLKECRYLLGRKALTE